MAKANAGQTDIVAVATTRVVEIWAGYYATTVDARQALKEMGIDADKDKARELFDALVPPDVRAAVDVPEVAVIVPEDPRIAALRAGLTVVRADWDLTRAFAQERLQQTIARLGANKTSRLDRQVPPVAAVGDKTNRRATHAKLIGDGLLRAAQLEQPANLAHMGLSQFVVGAFVSKDRAVDVLVVHVGFAGIPAEVAEPVVRRVVIGKVAGLHAIGTGTDERLKHELVDIALPRFPGFAVKRDAKVTGFRFDPSRDATPFTADKHARTAAAAPKAPRPQTPKGAVVANAIRREVVHEAVANRRIGSNHDVPFQQKGMLWPEPTTF
jgi:hypothetical protein